MTPRISSMPHVALLIETSTEYGRGLLRGIVKYASLHGPWDLSLAPGHFQQVFPKRTFWSGDGIIARIRSREVERLIRSVRLPVVASSLRESGAKLGSMSGEVRTASNNISRMAAEHLLGRGLRRLAFCGFIRCPWSEAREKALVRLAKDAGLPCFSFRIHLANWVQSPTWIRTWVHEQPLLANWLKSLPKPVGLMACNDTCGRAILQTCAAARLQVPDEVAVVGVDNDEMMCEVSSPQLSSVALDLENAGYEAARLLDGLMSGRLSGRHLVRVEPTRVVTRRSTDVIAQQDLVVSKALRFIRDHAGKPIGVPEVLDAVGASRRTLERRFGDAVGRSVHSEITHCRLERAKRFLLETDLSCSSVAAASGFGSTKSFSRAFRHIEAVSPAGFRKRANFAMVRQASRSTTQY